MIPLVLTLALASASGFVVTAVLLRRHRPDTGAPQLPHPRRAGDTTDLADESRTALALPVLGVVIAVAVVLFGALTVMVERSIGAVRWDEELSGWAADHASDLGTTSLTAITHLGDTASVMLVTTAVAVYGYVRTRRWGIPAFLASVVVGQFLLSNLIKLAVDRARPSLDPLAAFSGSSFPSGHTTAAAATYLGIALVLGLFFARRGRAALMGAAVGIAVAVGCSRALLGVHWLTDVLGGLILGWTWYAVCSTVFGGRRFAFGAAAADLEEKVQ